MSDQPRRGLRPRRGQAAGGEETRHADGGGSAAAVAAARIGPGEHVINVLAGLREPIVVILLLIAFFTSISGKPLDGLLMLIAGVSLAWDTGHRSRHARLAGGETVSGGPATDAAGGTAMDRLATGGVPSGGPAADGAPGTPWAEATPGPGPPEATPRPGPEATPGPGPEATPRPGPAEAAASWRRPVLTLTWVLGGALYILVVGSLRRYSWPATVAVVGLGSVVVITSWRGPRRDRPAPGPVPMRGLALWGVVFVLACLWELSSLLQQPTLATSSYAHPTISTLTDPLLSTWAGRSTVLAGWLLFGWFLAER